MLIKKGQMELASGFLGTRERVRGRDGERKGEGEGGQVGGRGDSPCIHSFTALTTQSICKVVVYTLLNTICASTLTVSLNKPEIIYMIL